MLKYTQLLINSYTELHQIKPNSPPNQSPYLPTLCVMIGIKALVTFNPYNILINEEPHIQGGTKIGL